MIRTENLSMVFTTEDVQTRALSNVNLEIKQGEFVAIMGPSGCGKSTLLNILGTLDIPTSGKYFINEKEMTKMDENQLSSFRKKNIGFVFQSFNLIDELTVFENVELPLVYLGIPKKERISKSNECIRTNEYSPSCQTLSTAIIRRTTTTSGHCSCNSHRLSFDISR